MAYQSRSEQRILAVVVTVTLIASFVTASLPAAHALVSPQAAGSNFNSSFNGSHAGWSGDGTTGAWTQDASHYSTVGIVGKGSSIKHSGTYTNFVYQVKMRRIGSGGSDNFVYVRGNPSSLNPLLDLWTTSYIFSYLTNQTFFVMKTTGGVVSTLVGPISNPYIIAGSGWNVLKVVFYGPAYLFYMNGVLMWAGYDSTYTSGNVGIGLFNGGIGQKLVVDWAKLSKIVGDPGPMPALTPGAAIPSIGGSHPYLSP